MGVLARLRDLATKLLTSTPLVGSASALPELPLYQQYSRIGGNITPAQASSIIQQADAGVMNQLVDLANEARQKDGHLHAVLSTRENALTSLQLMIDPAIAYGEEEPSERDVEIADFVRYALSYAVGNDQNVRSFRDLISQLNGAVYHGYAVSEIMWAIDEGMMIPVGFRPIDQRRFVFSLRDGRLRHSDSYSSMQEIDLQEQWPAKFIQHQPRINGDVPAREGLSRLLIWPALFRNWSTSDWLKLAELSWKPWRIGIYSKQANDDDKDDLLSALRTLTTNGVVVHREDHKLELRWAGQGSTSGTSGMGPHERLCDFMGREMSKAAIGQTMTIEPGDRGARSLGEVHDRVRKDICEQDAIATAATLRRDLIAWIVRLNYGDDVMVPGARFATDDTADLSEFSSAVKDLAGAGVPISESWVHDKIGHPEIDETTILIGEADIDDVDEEPEEEAEAEEAETQ
jgi:phage gp29-like protein